MGFFKRIVKNVKRVVKKVGKPVAIAAAAYATGGLSLAASAASYAGAALAAAAPYAGAAATILAARSRQAAPSGGGESQILLLPGTGTPGIGGFGGIDPYVGLGGGGSSSQIYPGGTEAPSGPSPMMLLTIAGVAIAFVMLLLAFRR